MEFLTLTSFKSQYITQVFRTNGEHKQNAKKALSIDYTTLVKYLDYSLQSFDDTGVPESLTLTEATNTYILMVFKAFEYNTKLTANALNVEEGTLSRWLKKWGLGTDKTTFSWKYTDFLHSAKPHPSIHEWFKATPGVVRSAYRGYTMPRLREELWSHTLNY